MNEELSPFSLWLARYGTGLAELGLILLLLFWIVGAYNRLMRLRQEVNAAWGQIDQLLLRRAALLGPLLQELISHMPEESASLNAVAQAQEKQRAAAQVVRARPTRSRELAAWLAAERDMVSPLARLEGLLSQRAELADHSLVGPARQQMNDVAAQLQFARQHFNLTAQGYNQAVNEIPTRLVARLFGLRAVMTV